MSLAGCRVVVTRSPEDAWELANVLAEAGAEPVFFPTIVRLPPEDPALVEAAWRRALDADRIVVGSAAALEAFAELGAPGHAPLPVACVGAATADKVRARFGDRFRVREIAEPRRAEVLVQALVDALGVGGRLDGRFFSFPRAPEGRLTLAEGLEDLGARVELVSTYRIGCAPGPDAASLAALDGVDAYTFLSGRTLDCFLEAVGDTEGRRRLAAARVAVIGPVAAERAAARGIRVDVVPPVASVAALVDALAER